MKEDKHLKKIDKSLLDIISHYGSIDFEDLWYELGESDDLTEELLSKDELLSRLEFLASVGLVKSKANKTWVLKE